jgi:hypothetical protein
VPRAVPHYRDAAHEAALARISMPVHFESCLNGDHPFVAHRVISRRGDG